MSVVNEHAGECPYNPDTQSRNNDSRRSRTDMLDGIIAGPDKQRERPEKVGVPEWILDQAM